MARRELTSDEGARIRKAAAAVAKAEGDLASARAAFRATLQRVHADGAPLQAIGDELDITRQRVAQLIQEAK